MDYRENAIINALISRRAVPLSELSDSLSVGNQYLLQLISRMNTGFKVAGLPVALVGKDRVLRLSDTPDDLPDRLREYLAGCGYDTYTLTRSERRTILSLIILNATEHMTAEALADHLQVSRNTILGDIGSVKSYLADGGIDLDSQSGRGYVVRASESAIRAKILEILSLNLTRQHYISVATEVFQHLLMGELCADQTMLDSVRTIMKEGENRHGCKLSDYSFRVTEYELVLLAGRLKKGRVVEVAYLEGIEQSSKYALSYDILTRIGGLFGIEIPDHEVGYFVQFLRRKSYVQSSTKHVDEMQDLILIEEVIFDVMRALGISFYLENDLHNMLVDHMRSVIYRIRADDRPIENPLLKEIKDRYGTAFAVIRRCMKPIEDMLGEELSDDEVAFLVMFFEAAIGQAHAEQAISHKARALVVCDMGRTVFKYLRSQLSSLRDLIDIVDERTGHDDSSNDGDIQMVISTLAYEMEGAMTVLVSSPMLTQADLAAIQACALRILMDSAEEGRGEVSPMQRLLMLDKLPTWDHSTSILSRDRIDLGRGAATLEEALEVAGSLLNRDGSVAREAVSFMRDGADGLRDRLQRGRAICPGCVISYVDEEHGALTDALSVVRLQAPLQVVPEQEPIRYVIGFSYLESDHLSDMLHAIIFLLRDGSIISILDMLDEPLEAYNYISRII